MPNYHADRIETLQAQDNAPPTSTDPMVKALRVYMHHKFLNILMLEDDCRQDKNIQSLRTMRTSVYQLKTLVYIMEHKYDQKTVKKAEKRLRQLIKRLDSVHELDVMMRDLLHYGAGLVQRMTIASLVAHLDAQRLLAREKLIKYMDSQKYHKFLDRFQEFLLAPADDVLNLEDEDPGDPQQVRHVLPVLLHRHLALVRSYDPFVASSDSDVFLALREDVRVLRQLIGCFEGVLGSSAAAYLQDLLKLEDLLNRISEASETLRRLIHLPRVNMDNDQLIALKNYRSDLRNRREKLYAKLPPIWEDFNRRRTQENLSQSILVLL